MKELLMKEKAKRLFWKAKYKAEYYSIEARWASNARVKLYYASRCDRWDLLQANIVKKYGENL